MLRKLRHLLRLRPARVKEGVRGSPTSRTDVLRGAEADTLVAVAASARDEILRRVLDAEHDLPAPPEPLWQEIMDEVVTLALRTHPTAQALLREAASEAPAERPSIEQLLRDLATTLLHFHPTADFFAVEDAGRAGARVVARRRGADASSIGDTWKHALWGMYLRVLDPPSLQVFREEPIAEAIIEGIGAAGDIFDVLDEGSAEARLIEAVRLIRLRMLMVRYDVAVDAKDRIPPKDEMH